MKSDNVFTTFIDLLKVKHTKTYSDKFFNEHPHKYDLYGISDMLSNYGIENVAVKVNDKNDLFQIETPFIAHVSIDFVVVYRITENEVHYIWEGKKTYISLKGFFDVWTGVVLIAEPDENSKESGFSDNVKTEYINKYQKIIFYLTVCTFIVSSAIIFDLYKNIGLLLLITISLFGFYIGFLLVLKHLKIHSNNSDKICSLFKKSDCNDVLNSKAARLWNIIGWSEIGLGYFMSNTFILLFFPCFVPFLAIVNVCALPFTLWSIWYQKIKVNQWCPLCLIVQIILWIIFIINLLCGFVYIPEPSINYIFIGCIYLIPIMLINLLVKKLMIGEKIENITQELKSIKLKGDVFNVLIKSQPYYKIEKSTSSILFGNIHSNNLITILTNPHCEPCAKMHEKIINLLVNNKDAYCIQYIFTSFDGLEDSSKYLMSVYNDYSVENSERIYTEWFNKGGKYNRELFFKKYLVDNTTKTDDEFSAHQKWLELSKINSTPTIFINGYQLSRLYQLEELSLLDFDEE